MHVRYRIALGLAVFSAGLSLHAQQAPASAATAADQSQTVKLNPFEVTTTQDKGYTTLNSNSITRFNTELSKMPVSADIFDQQFMDDTGAQTAEDMITQYSAGAGLSSPQAASSAVSSQPGDRSGAYITLRGLFAQAPERDGFMPNPSTDSAYSRLFDTERVEVIMGPQALLYAGGGAGGVINTVSKQARLGGGTFGEARYYIDQYGTKFGSVDYGVGTDRFALRFAAMDGTQRYFRQYLGGPVNGDYLQLAGKVGSDTGVQTIIRVTGEYQYYNRTLGQDPSLTSTGSSGGADRNGENLQYIMASHQAGAVSPAGSPFASGAVDNGLLNWSTVDSYGTWLNNNVTTTRYTALEADTTWLPWLTSRLDVGYTDQGSDKAGPGLSYYAPGAGGATDPDNSVWNVGFTPADSDTSNRTKGLRFSVASQNTFFGKIKSTSILGADYIRNDSALVAYNYFAADSNWNVIVNSASTANQGRTTLPKLYYPIDQGPGQSFYAFYMPRAQRITISGQGAGVDGNYVRMVTNPINPNLVGPQNPVGASVLGGSNYSLGHVISRGIYGDNQMDFMDGKLESILGFRLGDSVDRVNNQGYTPPQPPTTTKLSDGQTNSFSAGVNYGLTQYLRPYLELSDSFDPPLTQAQDPYGNNPPVAHALGGEAGIKIVNGSVVSGSLAYYHTKDHDEEYLITSTLMNDINPSGLNGTFGPRNQWVPTDRSSSGVQLLVVANPTSNWTMRLAGAWINGKIAKTTTYAQVWNDGFYTNSAGQVTYSNGTPVYVDSTAASAKSGKELAAGTANAVPLTLAMLNNPASAYYANPQSITGAIGSGSAPATIFGKPAFPNQGSILNGVVGVPVGQALINTSANPTIANYQAPPGVIPVTVAGDATTGYPEYALNFTTAYTFEDGWLRGFTVGGSELASWKLREYYYYVNGVGIGTARAVETFPNIATTNAMVRYRRKFGRIGWSIQMNVSNVFNHYDVIITPDAVNGFRNLQNLNATWNAQPRMYTLTNTITF